VFESLDFVYMPSRDVAADISRFEAVGAEVVWTVERFGTRVAMLRMTAQPPALLLAQHLHGDEPVLVFRVADLASAVAALGDAAGERFEIPPGDGVLLRLPGPQRLAIYEPTRAERLAGITGRRDF
jgi:hypothetical protein